jgi:epoxide hydrolase-like predicted phosphatase
VIKAVIFDCFGVLTTEAYDLFRDKYLGDNEPKRQTANKAMDDLNMGLIVYDDFLEELSKVSGLMTSEVEATLSKNQPNAPLFDYIRERLKPEYKIGMLSNAGSDWTSKIFKPEDVGLFDSIILSFQIGVIKPDARAYEFATQRLDVKPQECVFIDDREKYCEGARAVGMQAVLYDDLPKMKVALEKALAAGSDN